MAQVTGHIINWRGDKASSEGRKEDVAERELITRRAHLL